MCEYVKLQEFTSIDELYLYGCIEDDKYVKDIWNDFDFIVLDENYEYYYETGDSVFIKEQGLYGVVVKIEKSEKK